MNTTWNNLPMATCPHCGKEEQWDDYYDMEEGDSRECANCGKEVYVVEVDTVMVARLSTEGNYHA